MLVMYGTITSRRFSIRRAIWPIIFHEWHAPSMEDDWWARQDSNLQPRDYESPALTVVLQAQLQRVAILAMKQHAAYR